jgi:hypothetical protein
MYKITIEKIETVKYMARDYEKIADTGNKQDNGPVYGYVEHPEERQATTTILEQTIETLDLPEVIKAVNQLK